MAWRKKRNGTTIFPYSLRTPEYQTELSRDLRERVKREEESLSPDLWSVNMGWAPDFSIFKVLSWTAMRHSLSLIKAIIKENHRQHLKDMKGSFQYSVIPTLDTDFALLDVAAPFFWLSVWSQQAYNSELCFWCGLRLEHKSCQTLSVSKPMLTHWRCKKVY